MTTIVTINTNCERRTTEVAYKNKMLLEPGFLRFGFVVAFVSFANHAHVHIEHSIVGLFQKQ